MFRLSNILFLLSCLFFINLFYSSTLILFITNTLSCDFSIREISFIHRLTLFYYHLSSVSMSDLFTHLSPSPSLPSSLVSLFSFLFPYFNRPRVGYEHQCWLNKRGRFLNCLWNLNTEMHFNLYGLLILTWMVWYVYQWCWMCYVRDFKDGDGDGDEVDDNDKGNVEEMKWMKK